MSDQSPEPVKQLPEALPKTETPAPIEVKKPEETKNQEKRNSFKPTPLMRSWLKKGFELNTTAPNEIGKALDSRVANFYEWHMKPGFTEWWDKQWMQFFLEHRFRLMEIAFKQAEKSEPFLIRLMRFFGFTLPVDVTQELVIQRDIQIAQNIPPPQNVPPVTPSITNINIIAAAVEKAAKERGITLDDNSAATPTVGQDGPKKDH